MEVADAAVLAGKWLAGKCCVFSFKKHKKKNAKNTGDRYG
jgi:hypothetical protein